MATTRIILTTDAGKMFDALSDLGGDTGPLGTRLAGLLMTGEVSFSDMVALAVYGVTVEVAE